MKPQEVIIRVVVEQPTAATSDFTEVKTGKDHTPSQRLRLALMDVWEDDHPDSRMDEAWYGEQVDRIISVIEKRKR